MLDHLKQVFSSGSFIPHGHCYLWQPQLVWLHILSDSIIALAYYSIPLTLFYFIQKRKDIPFGWVFLLFGAFIISCGTTHLMEIWTLWHPTYWLSGLLKASTALISLYTAISLVQLIPQALALPSPSQLVAINEQLTLQIHDRQQAEAQVRQLNQDLEEKVARRTEQLNSSIAQVQDYAERMTLAMDAAQMGAWDWDLKTQKITWSAYHEILFGYQPGRPDRSYEDWARRIHPDDLPQIQAAVQKAMETNTSFLEEYRVIWEDGSLHWLAGFGRFFFDNDGQPLRMLGMVQDVSDRKRAEAALLESEDRFRTLADNISQLAWMADETGTIFWYNRRWFDYTGTTLEQTQGWGWQQVHHPKYLAEVTDRYRSHIESATIWEDTFPLRGKDGTYRWFLSRAIPISNQQGQVVRWFGTNTDVTDLKMAQATLEDRNNELDSFAHIVSHDLKAPLRAISNLSQWIEEDLEGSLSADIQDQMALLRNRVYRMQSMIDGLLNYARVGRTESVIDQVAIAELLCEVIDSISPPPAFTITLAPNLPVLQAKRLLLSQVFTNLIDNAIKYHDRLDGTVHISAQDQGEFVEFIVADDGPGIAPEYCDNIFTIFQTGTPKNQQDSTGIGLAIVKKIVETEAGSIRLESQVGQGTTFYFTWPKLQDVISD